MNDSTNKVFEQAAAFQKIWIETFTKLAQTGFSLSPESAPPEILRQMRSGIFSALAQAWDEFLRSPQFLESTKAMMESAITFRKMSNDFLTQAHHGLQGTAQADIDNLLLAIRHMETRILDRVEDLSTRLEHLERSLNGAARNGEAETGKRPAGAIRPRRGTARDTGRKFNRTD
jgi:hypothetical protein